MVVSAPVSSRPSLCCCSLGGRKAPSSIVASPRDDLVGDQRRAVSSEKHATPSERRGDRESWWPRSSPRMSCVATRRGSSCTLPASSDAATAAQFTPCHFPARPTRNWTDLEPRCTRYHSRHVSADRLEHLSSDEIRSPFVPPPPAPPRIYYSFK